MRVASSRATAPMSKLLLPAPRPRLPPPINHRRPPPPVYWRADASSATALPYTKRAAAYISLRQLSQALRDLNKAVELDPAFVQVPTIHGDMP